MRSAAFSVALALIVLPLIALGLIVGFALLSYGGVTPEQWNIVLVALCACSILYWLPGKATRFAPAPARVFSLLLLLFVGYVASQLIPLPSTLIRVLSPERAEIAAALDPEHSRWISLSVAPAITWAHLMRICGYILVFFLVRDLSWRLSRPGSFQKTALLTIPLILFVTIESVIGIVQSFANGGSASGTYVNPDHFAGLLEMLLPFPVMLAAGLYRDLRRESSESLPMTGLICLLVGAAAVTLIAALDSRSRVAPVAIAADTVVMCALGFRSARTRRSRRAAAFAAALAGLSIVVLAVPLTLTEKYSQLMPQAALAVPAPQNSLPEVTPDLRFQIWRETGNMIRHYPLFGSGGGTFVSAFQKYRESAPLSLVDYAHNDYLQIMAEYGVLGFLMAAELLFLVFRSAFRAASRELNPRRRDIAIACVAGLLALALHSTVEFHFYIPATMLIAAWIAGLASGIEIESA